MRVKAAHVDSGQAERSNLVHLAHNLCDFLFALLTNHTFRPLSLIFFRKLKHDILQHLVHSRDDLLRILDKLTMQLATRRERAQILAIQV